MMAFLPLLGLCLLSNASPVSFDGLKSAANYQTNSGLPEHTIFTPSSMSASDNATYPVMIWGNGACYDDGNAQGKFLAAVANSGYICIASGNPGGKGTSTAKLMTNALDFITGSQSKQGNLSGKTDAKNIIVSGWSCGGLEAISTASDSRVKLLGVYSSGLTDTGNNYELARIKVPVYYFLGGSGDIAYPNGERDYKNLPAGLPKWKGNYPVGHSGTYGDRNGGEFATETTIMLDYKLKGKGKLSDLNRSRWTIVSANGC